MTQPTLARRFSILIIGLILSAWTPPGWSTSSYDFLDTDARRLSADVRVAMIKTILLGLEGKLERSEMAAYRRACVLRGLILAHTLTADENSHLTWNEVAGARILELVKSIARIDPDRFRTLGSDLSIRLQGPVVSGDHPSAVGLYYHALMALDLSSFFLLDGSFVSQLVSRLNHARNEDRVVDLLITTLAANFRQNLYALDHGGQSDSLTNMARVREFVYVEPLFYRLYQSRAFALSAIAPDEVDRHEFAKRLDPMLMIFVNSVRAAGPIPTATQIEHVQLAYDDVQKLFAESPFVRRLTGWCAGALEN